MPDHLHLFCTPSTDDSLPLKSWVKFWKSRFSRTPGTEVGQWQAGFWDTLLRRNESYQEKWEYVQNNPVRAGLVLRSQDWPYQGELNEISWPR